MTDRPCFVAGSGDRVDVRRLMYQALIWRCGGDQPCGLAAALDPKRVERVADALIDGVRRNAELERNFLGREMLVDQREALALALS